MKKKNKYTVTVNGFVKLLAAIAIFIASFTLKSTIALLALWTYALLFILLAVLGSNNKFCEWLSDRKADYSSKDDHSEKGKYTARWESRPDSDVRNNVIHLRGTIIVEYTGTLFQDSADEVIRDLLQSYVNRVRAEMPGYSVDKSTVQVKYVKVG